MVEEKEHWKNKTGEPAARGLGFGLKNLEHFSGFSKDEKNIYFRNIIRHSMSIWCMKLVSREKVQTPV